MTKKLAWAPCFILGTLLAVALAAPVRAEQASGDAEQGKSLYLEHNCYSCHGYNGSARPEANLAQTDGILSDEGIFISFLRMRSELSPLLPSSRMPNFSEADISDQEARDIYAYILTFTPQTPEIEDAPLLQGILEETRNRRAP